MMENAILGILLGNQYKGQQVLIPDLDMQSAGVTFVPAGSTIDSYVDLKQQKNCGGDNKQSKVNNVPELHVQPEPEETPTKYKHSKAFVHEGPNLPQPPAQDNDPLGKLGIFKRKADEGQSKFPVSYYTGVSSRPNDSFSQGKTKLATTKGLKQMLTQLPLLTSGTHGCIIDENLDPECDAYEQGIHFLNIHKLGKGSYGTVDLCIDTNNSKQFVRKTIKKSNLRTSEINVPINLGHPNITKLLGLIQRDHEEEGLDIELLLEYGGVALHQYLVMDDNILTQTQIWNLTKQGLSALNHLDYYSMIHLDIKPENLCIQARDNSLQLKITDFGSSKLPHEPIQFIGWTPEYMAPESCKLFLQKSRQGDLNWGLTESDITGKVDVFALALVVMFMYKKYHLLLKLITKGNTSYKDFDPNERKLMQFQLMISLAGDADFVHTLIPDECDIDMRELLMKMTQHEYSQRFSAKQALNLIEGREKRIGLAILQNQQKQLQAQQELERMRQQFQHLSSCEPAQVTNLPLNQIIDDENFETGPIKNTTKDKLRQKLKPYSNFSKSGKTESRNSFSKGLASKAMSPMSPYVEMMELSSSSVPSKRMMPQTPVMEMTQLSLHQQLTERPYGSRRGQKSEKMMAPVTQPQTDVEHTVVRPYIMVETPEYITRQEQPVTPILTERMQMNVPTPALVQQPGSVKMEQEQFNVLLQFLLQNTAQIETPTQSAPISIGGGNGTWGNAQMDFQSVSTRRVVGQAPRQHNTGKSLGGGLMGRSQVRQVTPQTPAVQDDDVDMGNNGDIGNLPNLDFLK